MIVTARTLACPAAMNAPEEVSNFTARCWTVPSFLSVTPMTVVEKPSAGTDWRLMDTSKTSCAASGVIATLNSYERSRAVTRTRAVPATLSLCSCTTACPVESAVSVTLRELVCPVEMKMPSEVSNLTARC